MCTNHNCISVPTLPTKKDNILKYNYLHEKIQSVGVKFNLLLVGSVGSQSVAFWLYRLAESIDFTVYLISLVGKVGTIIRKR